MGPAPETPFLSDADLSDDMPLPFVFVEDTDDNPFEMPPREAAEADKPYEREGLFDDEFDQRQQDTEQATASLGKQPYETNPFWLDASELDAFDAPDSSKAPAEVEERR